MRYLLVLAKGVPIQNSCYFMHNVLYYIKTIFRGFSEIMLQSNAFTGLLFFSAVSYDSLLIGLGGLIANVVGILTAQYLDCSKKQIELGMYGFNPSLMGMGLFYFMEPSFWIWITLIITSIACTVIMKYALERGLPAYTFPYVFMTWVALLLLSLPGMPVTAIEHQSHVVKSIDVFLLEGHAFGQVIFQGSFIAGFIFFVGVFINNPIAALYGFFAVIFSIFISKQGGDSSELVTSGVFCFNAILCAIAMGGDKLRDGLYVLISVTIATYADVFMIHIGFPSLTFPFVLAMWIMFPIKQLDRWVVIQYRKFNGIFFNLDR